MGIKSAAYLRGRRIELVKNVWIYFDTGEPILQITEKEPEDKGCYKCGGIGGVGLMRCPICNKDGKKKRKPLDHL